VSQTYSSAWFETFLPSSNPPPVDPELAFLRTHLPLPDFARVLDVCCGVGRHAAALAALGYDVLGIDVSHAALAAARERAPGAEFRALDMRRVDSLDGRRDAVMCLWQSFGGFTDEVNRSVLGGMARTLRARGRLLLDVYNRDALPGLPAMETASREGREFVTRRSLVDRRYRVDISYAGSDVVDHFEWEAFTPAELIDAASTRGLSHLLTCAWFDPAMPAGPDHVRMQLLFERS
jgi:SAM-dependent methyltransferase